MTEGTATVAAVCVSAAILATLLRQYCREQAMFCTIAACIAVGTAALLYMEPVTESVGELFSRTGLPKGYLKILWKALGICYVTTIAGDLCQDCGETALARVAELWGRISLLLLSLPLLETLLQTVTEVLP